MMMMMYLNRAGAGVGGQFQAVQSRMLTGCTSVGGAAQGKLLSGGGAGKVKAGFAARFVGFHLQESETYFCICFYNILHLSSAYKDSKICL